MKLPAYVLLGCVYFGVDFGAMASFAGTYYAKDSNLIYFASFENTMVPHTRHKMMHPTQVSVETCAQLCRLRADYTQPDDAEQQNNEVLTINYAKNNIESNSKRNIFEQNTALHESAVEPGLSYSNLVNIVRDKRVGSRMKRASDSDSEGFCQAFEYVQAVGMCILIIANDTMTWDGFSALKPAIGTDYFELEIKALSHFVRIKQHRLKDESRYYSLQKNVPISVCAHNCMTSSGMDCNSFAYNPSMRICAYNSVIMLNSSQLIMDASYDYYQDNGRWPCNATLPWNYTPRVIASQNYPYVNNNNHVTCHYRLVAPPGERIILHVKTFYTNRKTCNGSRGGVVVYDGHESEETMIGALCNQNDGRLPRYFKSTNRILFVRLSQWGSTFVTKMVFEFEKTNICDSRPCFNSGTCQCVQLNQYACLCRNGFTGRHCESDIGNCSSMPCLFGGTCVDQIDNYMCHCPRGISGSRCEQYIGDCFSEPCLNNATCYPTTSGYTCACANGFTGFNCEYNVNECFSSPCIKGQCVDKINGYECICDQDFSGKHCEMNTSVASCNRKECRFGTCAINETGSYCQCFPGFTGVSCDLDIDECRSNPCMHGICVHHVNSFQCKCTEGYVGKHCDLLAEDPCRGSPCHHGYCSIQNGGFKCICEERYTGTQCESILSVCDYLCQNGFCVDRHLSEPTCVCFEGFLGQYCELNSSHCSDTNQSPICIIKNTEPVPTKNMTTFVPSLSSGTSHMNITTTLNIPKGNTVITPHANLQTTGASVAFKTPNVSTTLTTTPLSVKPGNSQGTVSTMNNTLNYLPSTVSTKTSFKTMPYSPTIKSRLNYTTLPNVPTISNAQLNYTTLPNVPTIPNAKLNYTTLPNVPTISNAQINYKTLPNVPTISNAQINYTTLPNAPTISNTQINYTTLPNLPTMPNTQMNYTPLSNLPTISNTQLNYTTLPKLPTIPNTQINYTAFPYQTTTYNTRMHYQPTTYATKMHYVTPPYYPTSMMSALHTTTRLHSITSPVSEVSHNLAGGHERGLNFTATSIYSRTPMTTVFPKGLTTNTKHTNSLPLSWEVSVSRTTQPPTMTNTDSSNVSYQTPVINYTSATNSTKLISMTTTPTQPPDSKSATETRTMTTTPSQSQDSKSATETHTMTTSPSQSPESTSVTKTTSTTTVPSLTPVSTSVTETNTMTTPHPPPGSTSVSEMSTLTTMPSTLDSASTTKPLPDATSTTSTNFSTATNSVRSPLTTLYSKHTTFTSLPLQSMMSTHFETQTNVTTSATPFEKYVTKIYDELTTVKTSAASRITTQVQPDDANDIITVESVLVGALFMALVAVGCIGGFLFYKRTHSGSVYITPPISKPKKDDTAVKKRYSSREIHSDLKKGRLFRTPGISRDMHISTDSTRGNVYESGIPPIRTQTSSPTSSSVSATSTSSRLSYTDLYTRPNVIHRQAKRRSSTSISTVSSFSDGYDAIETPVIMIGKPTPGQIVTGNDAIETPVIMMGKPTPGQILTRNEAIETPVIMIGKPTPGQIVTGNDAIETPVVMCKAAPSHVVARNRHTANSSMSDTLATVDTPVIMIGKPTLGQIITGNDAIETPVIMIGKPTPGQIITGNDAINIHNTNPSNSCGLRNTNHVFNTDGLTNQSCNGDDSTNHEYYSDDTISSDTDSFGGNPFFRQHNGSISLNLKQRRRSRTQEEFQALLEEILETEDYQAFTRPGTRTSVYNIEGTQTGNSEV